MVNQNLEQKQDIEMHKKVEETLKNIKYNFCNNAYSKFD